jgi:exonuclease SbcC
MRLNRLQMSNFRLHVDTRIDFEQGLTGIIGPNGSGKTTILEAIAWALYGMAAVRGKRQDIRSLTATGRAGVKVALDFELAGHRYRVVRTLSSAELYLDGSSSPIANSTTGVTDLLRRRLGMSQQEFFHTYFTGQKELGVMAAMGPAERAQFLSRVLGYEKLRGAQSLARERRNVIRGELSGLQSAMPDGETIARLLAETESRLKDAEVRASAALAALTQSNAKALELTPRWTEAQKARDAHQQLEAELAVRESEDASLARDAERLDRELADIAAAVAEIDAIASELEIQRDLEARLHDMNRLFQEEGKRRALLQNQRSLGDELAALRQRAEALSASADVLRDAERARDASRHDLDALAQRLEAARTDWVRDQQEALTKLEEYRRQFAEIKQQREQLATLGPDSPCPICTRPLATHFREVLEDLDGKLTAVEVDGKYYRNRVDQLAEAPAAVRELEAEVAANEQLLERRLRLVTDAELRAQEHAQLVREIAGREARLATIATELESLPGGYHETRHAQLQQQHNALAPMARRYAQLTAQSQRAPAATKERLRVQKAHARVRDRIDALTQQRKKSRFSEKAFTELRAAFDRAVSELRAAELAALAAEKELEAARAARAAAESNRRELDRVQSRMRGLTMDRRLHDELDLAFTDIRAGLNEHLRPEISEIASGFLTELTDGRYTDLELDDDYGIVVKEDDIPKPVISGGEEDLAHLVLRLAISQMIADRAGQSFSLLILDEIFGSLDETRRHNVVELLRRLHDRFEQVILITHIESVREGLDRVLTVRYDEDAGVSRVEREGGASALIEETSVTDEYAEAGASGSD